MFKTAEIVLAGMTIRATALGLTDEEFDELHIPRLPPETRRDSLADAVLTNWPLEPVPVAQEPKG